MRCFMSTRHFGRVAAISSVILAVTCVAPSGAQEKAPQPARTPQQEAALKNYFGEQPAAPSAAKKDPAEVLKSLNDLINSYADENARLHARVRELEAQVKKLAENRTVTIVPQPGTPRNQVPPDWKPFRFNGGTYYIVPLEGTGAKASETVIETPPPRPPTATQSR